MPYLSALEMSLLSIKHYTNVLYLLNNVVQIKVQISLPIYKLCMKRSYKNTQMKKYTTVINYSAAVLINLDAKCQYQYTHCQCHGWSITPT